MLYGNQSISHYTPSNVFIWMAMAFQAGVINIGGFLACQRFVSHITGFATHFGYEFNQSSASHAWGMLLVPLFFLLGAMVSGVLVDHRLQSQRAPKYYLTFAIMFLILFFIFIGGIYNLFGTFGDHLETSKGYSLVFLLCFVCGIQNGMMTTVSKSVIRTTHLTGITTDLGIGLIRILHQKKLNLTLDNERKANLMRIGIIIFFLIGSVIGGSVFLKSGYYGFILPVLTSGSLLSAMLYIQIFHFKNRSL